MDSGRIAKKETEGDKWTWAGGVSTKGARPQGGYSLRECLDFILSEKTIWWYTASLDLIGLRKCGCFPKRFQVGSFQGTEVQLDLFVWEKCSGHGCGQVPQPSIASHQTTATMIGGFGAQVFGVSRTHGLAWKLDLSFRALPDDDGDDDGGDDESCLGPWLSGDEGACKYFQTVADMKKKANVKDPSNSAQKALLQEGGSVPVSRHANL